jgi:hypothetical protein
MPDVAGRRLSFLVYAARSGSTFLARSLAEATTDLVVVPEFRLPYFLLVRSEDEVRNLGPDGVRRLIDMDPQFNGALGLSSDEIDEFASQVGSAGTRRILDEIAARYVLRTGLDAGHVVFKAGGASAFRSRLAEVVPDAHFVHVKRDPRGVVASLLHTEKAFFPGEDMARGDVVHCAKAWVRDMAHVAAAEESGIPVHTVRYERLVTDPAAEIDAVLRFLGAVRRDGAGAAYFAVGEDEELLHPNLERPALAERARAWEKSLTPWQGVAVEWWTRRSMEREGYTPWFGSQRGLAGRVASVIRAWLVHVWASLRYVVRRVAQFRRKPRQLVEMLRLRRSRRRG